MAAKPPERINGKKDQLEELRQKARTVYMSDPERLKRVRARAKQEARRTLLETKCITEEELAALEEETT